MAIDFKKVAADLKKHSEKYGMGPYTADQKIEITQDFFAGLSAEEQQSSVIVSEFSKIFLNLFKGEQ